MASLKVEICLKKKNPTRAQIFRYFRIESRNNKPQTNRSQDGPVKNFRIGASTSRKSIKRANVTDKILNK